jgi:hypothetical protein
MFLIDGITKSIQAKTVAAPSADLQCVVHYNDVSQDGANVNIGPTELTSGIDNSYADIVPTVVDGQKRRVVYISIYNPNADTHNLLITLYDTIGPTTSVVHRVQLPFAWRAEYNVDEGWKLYNEVGIVVTEKAPARILSQSNPGAVLTDLYTVPSGKSARVMFTAANRSGANKTIRISIAPLGAADAVSQYIYYDKVVVANDTQQDNVFYELKETDVVRVYGSTNDVSFTINGIEN